MTARLRLCSDVSSASHSMYYDCGWCQLSPHPHPSSSQSRQNVCHYMQCSTAALMGPINMLYAPYIMSPCVTHSVPCVRAHSNPVRMLHWQCSSGSSSHHPASFSARKSVSLSQREKLPHCCDWQGVKLVAIAVDVIHMLHRGGALSPPLAQAWGIPG